MTREEAMRAAAQYVVANGLPVNSEPEAMRHIDAERFNRLFGETCYEHDMWLIDFKKKLPPGVECIFPSTIMIAVEEPHGKTYEYRRPAPKD